jgi:hypothetical protein
MHSGLVEGALTALSLSRHSSLESPQRFMFAAAADCSDQQIAARVEARFARRRCPSANARFTMKNEGLRHVRVLGMSGIDLCSVVASRFNPGP